MLKRPLTFVLLAGASWLAQSAVAGELTLFSRPDFRGRDVTVERSVRDLNRIGFNDRASSLVVRSGRWQVCEHANFQGQCVVLEPGEYRDLRRLGDQVSSVREVDERRGGWHDDGRDGRRDDNRGDKRYDRNGPAVELFRKAEFRDDRRDLNLNELRDFGAIGFHDRTQSMIIHEGRWEFCEHADFRGQCQVYGPGRYAHLGHMSSKFSSARRVR